MNTARSGELLTGILKDVSRSFYLTLRVLPRPVRSQIGLAYLLARTTDTIADTDLVPFEQRLDALRKLRARISGDTNEPVTFAAFSQQQHSNAEKTLLLRTDESLSLLKSCDPEDREDIVSVLKTITTGQEQDLIRFSGAGARDVRALDNAAGLDTYTHLVAGCVGEFWTRICRRHLFPTVHLDEKQLLARGVRFGKGLQLVNILRDIPSDLRMGRCYLPMDQLSGIGLTPSGLLNKDNFEKLRPVYLDWVSLAESHLREGWHYTNTLPYGQMRLRLACAWPLQIGFETLRLLRSANPLDPDTRPKVTRSRVKMLIFKSVLLYPFPSAWPHIVP